MKRINKRTLRESNHMFNVSATIYEEPEFNVRILIPTELKNLWEDGKVLYNVNMPYDDSIGPEFFVDDNALFIDAEAAIRSHKFMDEDERIIDEEYGELPNKIYAMNDDGEFDDEFEFINCDNDYFNGPEEFSEDTWRLDWYGCDQDEFDDKYFEYFEEYPGDSTMSDDDFDDEDDEENEDDWDDDEYEESIRRHHNKHVHESYDENDIYDEDDLNDETIRKWYPWRDPESEYYEGEKEEDPETIRKWYPWRDPESEYYEGPCDDEEPYSESFKKGYKNKLRERSKFSQEVKDLLK